MRRRRPSSAVRTVTASVGPRTAGIVSAGTSTTLAKGKRNSRFARGCSGESQRTTVGSRYVEPSQLHDPRAGPVPGGHVARAPGTSRSRSIIAEMRRATSGLAKGASWRLGVVLRARDDARRTVAASASAISRPRVAVHTPEALTQERPPFSAMDEAITSRCFGHSSAMSGPSSTLL